MFELNVNSISANSVLEIRIARQMNYKFNAVLLDMQGNVVEEFSLSDPKQNIDICHLPDNIYILQIFDAEDHMITYKMFSHSKNNPLSFQLT